jgi:hypothetical protein
MLLSQPLPNGRNVAGSTHLAQKSEVASDPADADYRDGAAFVEPRARIGQAIS